MGEQLQINVRRQSENWRSSPVVVVADTVRTPADIDRSLTAFAQGGTFEAEPVANSTAG